MIFSSKDLQELQDYFISLIDKNQFEVFYRMSAPLDVYVDANKISSALEIRNRVSKAFAESDSEDYSYYKEMKDYRTLIESAAKELNEELKIKDVKIFGFYKIDFIADTAAWLFYPKVHLSIRYAIKEK